MLRAHHKFEHMKSIVLACATLLITALSFGQDSKKVAITFTYKGNPLCYWDVTIKQGDVEIGRAKTDENGKADFGYCRLAYNGVDAYGYKKTPNGEKKWDVKGYIGIAESGDTKFDFLPLVEDTGMGGMMEAAWGLTLNDCSGSSSSSSSSSATNGGGSSSSGSSASQEQKDEMDEWEKEQEAKRAEQKAKQDQWNADWESGKTQAEGLQNSKAMYENKIANLDVKVQKKKIEQAKVAAGSKEHSELSYEIRDLELDKALTELKLEKTNMMIAKGNQQLNKAEKFPLEQKEEAFKAEQDSLKEAQKSGALFGISTTAASNNKNETGEKQNQDVKTEQVGTVENKTEEKTSNNPRNYDSEGEEVLKLYTAEELTQLSVMNIKKLKLDYNSKITNRKVGLKTKSSIWKPEKIEKVKTELAELEKQIILFDAELAKRKESAE